MNPYSHLSKKELVRLIEARDRAHMGNKTTKMIRNIEPENNPHSSLLKAVLDTIDELIYIVDLESDKIIFANKKVETLFGVLKGERCWNKLQVKQNGVCEFCTNHYLLDKSGHPTGVHQSIYQSRLTKKWFQCSDQAFEWNDGRMVAIKTCVNVTALKESSLSVQELLKRNKKLTQNIVVSIDNERRKLSQDFHDEIGQIATGIKLNADFLVTHEMGSKLSAAVDIVNLSKQLLNTVRNISYSLNPRILILNLTVYEMIQGLFDEWAKRNRNTQSNLSLDFELNLDLNIRLKEMLYRVIQEALTNISRHSKATQVSVVCSISPKAQKSSLAERKEIKSNTHLFDLKITDNGVGFPEKQDNCNLGLIYMKKRVKALGGQLHKRKPPDGGAQIHVVVPCQTIFKDSVTE